MGIADDFQELKEQQHSIMLRQAALQKRMSDLRERVKNGESLHQDPAEDYLFLNSGFGGDDFAQKIRSMYGTIAQDVQVLKIFAHEGIHGCPGIVAPEFIQPIFLHIDTAYSLGIAEGRPVFDLKKGTITVPMVKYAHKADDSWILQDGPLILSPTELLYLGKKASRRRHPMKNDFSEQFQQGLQVFSGAEVEAYYRTLDAERYETLSDSVQYGQDRTSPFINLSYVEALHLLRRKAPEDFEQAYARKMREERESVLGKLIALITTRPSPDEMRRTLKEALRFGMHLDDRVLPLDQPGVSLNIQMYVTELCEKYEVPLP